MEPSLLHAAKEKIRLIHMPKIRNWLESFLSHLDIECGLSRNTLQSYRYDLEQFIQVAQVASLNVSKEQIETWQNHLLDLKPSSRARKFTGVKRFFEYLVKQKQLEASPLNTAFYPL